MQQHALENTWNNMIALRKDVTIFLEKMSLLSTHIVIYRYDANKIFLTFLILIFYCSLNDKHNLDFEHLNILFSPIFFEKQRNSIEHEIRLFFFTLCTEICIFIFLCSFFSFLNNYVPSSNKNRFRIK